MAVGPIPFRAINEFAIRYGIEDIDEFDRFRAFMRELDEEYFAQQKSQEKGPNGEVLHDMTDIDAIKGMIRRAGEAWEASQAAMNNRLTEDEDD